MLTGVSLKRFRGFADFELKFDGSEPIAALVGKNSSGKTTILRAIRLACEAFDRAISDPDCAPFTANDGSLGVHAKGGSIVEDLATLVGLSDWRQVFTGATGGDGTEAVITLHFEEIDALQRLEVTLVWGRNAQLKLYVNVWSARALAAVAEIPVRSKFRAPRLRDRLLLLRPIVVFVPAFYGVTRGEEYRTQPIVDRQLGDGDQSHIVRNLVARLDGGALERLNAFLAATVRARIISRTPGQDAESIAELKVSFRDTNGELELSAAGTGLTSLIALFAAMDSVRRRRELAGLVALLSAPAIFLLDEPEAHLHPRLQGDVAEQLAELALSFGVQLIVATHSVEMINRLGRRDDTVLFSVERLEKSAVPLRSQSDLIGALDAFCDLTPFTSLNFLSSRRVLFFEGKDDYRVLDACARVYFRNDDARLRLFREYTPIALDGVGNVSAKGVLQKVLSPELFPALRDGDVVRIVLVRDRDFTREPTQPQWRVEKAYFEVLDLVWSRHSIESLFVSRECLSAWFEPLLGEGAAPELGEAIDGAIKKANLDRDLEERASDGLRPVYRRPDKEGKMLTEERAVKQAREEARQAPEVWQKGKDRAAKVMEEIRTVLGKPARALRGSMVDIIDHVSPNSVVRVNDAIPAEIRALLDALVEERTSAQDGRAGGRRRKGRSRKSE